MAFSTECVALNLHHGVNKQGTLQREEHTTGIFEETYDLNDGNRIPCLAFGAWQMDDNTATAWNHYLRKR